MVDRLIEPHIMPSAGVETKIRLIGEEEATGDTAAAYQYFREQTGRQNVPGILQCFGTDPTFVRQMVDISSTLLFADGYLSRQQKEMIATYISKLNDCPYCLDSHGFFLLAQGAPEDVANGVMAGQIEDAAIPEAERELLLYLGKVNGESFRTTKEDVQRLRDLGWQEEAIAEAVHVTAMMGLCNRVANAFGLAPQGYLEMKRPGSSSAPFA
jgi:uncharacterized peroxidase-related enzyme